MRSCFWLLAAFAALAGCSTTPNPKIHTEYDPKATFDQYKTYAWNPTAAGPDQIATARDPAARAMIIAAIDREMARKGLVKVAIDGDPSFVVTALGSAQRQIEVNNYGYTYAGSYVYGPGYAVATPSTQVRDYHVGTLILDFSDARSKQLFWRGIATDTIEDVGKLRKTIDEVARRLLDSYPPAPK